MNKNLNSPVSDTITMEKVDKNKWAAAEPTGHQHVKL